MALVAIDVDLANTIQAIDGILARREGEQDTMWESLGDKLQVVFLAVGDLDRIYFELLAEVENIFAQPQPSSERISNVIDQASIYCTDTTLTMRLTEWQSEIHAAAFDHTVKHRRYRDLASTLRSINDPLSKYLQRLLHLQATNALVVPTDDQHWDLRTVLELLKSVAICLTEDGQIDKGLPDPVDACEQAIRNYNRSLSLALAQLIGHARQDLAMDRL